jgi:gas vesicle protein
MNRFFGWSFIINKPDNQQGWLRRNKMVGENGTQGMAKRNSAGLEMFVGGLLLGTLVGGIIALLYAPMKGEDTRRMLKEKAGEAERMLEEKSEELKERAGEAMAEVREKAAEVKKRGENALDCIKQA